MKQIITNSWSRPAPKHKAEVWLGRFGSPFFGYFTPKPASN